MLRILWLYYGKSSQFPKPAAGYIRIKLLIKEGKEENNVKDLKFFQIQHSLRIKFPILSKSFLWNRRNLRRIHMFFDFLKWTFQIE